MLVKFRETFLKTLALAWLLIFGPLLCDMSFLKDLFISYLKFLYSCHIFSPLLQDNFRAKRRLFIKQPVLKLVNPVLNLINLIHPVLNLAELRLCSF